MKTISSRKIAVTAVFLALIAIFTFTPLGFLQIGPISTAFILIVLVTLAAQLEGLWVGVICSTAFGVFSLINAFTRPSPLAFCFQNPLISIVPRVIMGFTTYFAFWGMKKLMKKENSFFKDKFPSILSAIVAVLTNTGLVLGFMAMGYGSVVLEGMGQTVIQLITTVTLVVNFPIELVLNIVFVPLLYTVLKKYAYKGV